MLFPYFRYNEMCKYYMFHWMNSDKCIVSAHAHSCLTMTPWAVAHQTPLSMEFSRQEYWSRLPLPSLGDRPI